MKSHSSRKEGVLAVLTENRKSFDFPTKSQSHPDNTMKSFYVWATCFLLAVTLSAQEPARETTLGKSCQAFDKAHAALEAAFRKSITEMFDSGIASVEKALKELTEKGNLTEALIAKNLKEELVKERKEFVESGTLEPAKIPNPPPKWLALRNVYSERRNAQVRAENEFKRGTTSLYQDHIAELNKLAKETTQTGELQTAKTIKEYADEMQSHLSELSKATSGVAEQVKKRPSAEEKLFATPDITPLTPEQRQILQKKLESLPGSLRHRPFKGGGSWNLYGDTDKNEERVLVAGKDKQTWIFDFDTAKIIGMVPATNVCSARFHPTRPWFFTASRDQPSVIRWNAENYTKSTEFKLHSGAFVQCMAIAADGSFGVSGGTDKRVVLWDTESGKMLDVFQGFNGTVQCVAVSPDGKTVAAAGEDRSIIVWNLKNKKPLFVLKNVVKDNFNNLVFSPDGEKLAATAHGDAPYALIWDVRTGQPWRLIGGYGEPIRSIDFSPDGKRVVTGDGKLAIIIWDLASRQPMFRDTRSQDFRVWQIRWLVKHPDVVIGFSGYCPDVHHFPPLPNENVEK